MPAKSNILKSRLVIVAFSEPEGGLVAKPHQFSIHQPSFDSNIFCVPSKRSVEAAFSAFAEIFNVSLFSLYFL